MDYRYMVEKRDERRISKLNMLHNVDTFWDDVKELTKNIKTDRAIGRWEILAEIRFRELTGDMQ